MISKKELYKLSRAYDFEIWFPEFVVAADSVHAGACRVALERVKNGSVDDAYNVSSFFRDVRDGESDRYLGARFSNFDTYLRDVIFESVIECM
jgi:hypothetical protein